MPGCATVFSLSGLLLVSLLAWGDVGTHEHPVPRDTLNLQLSRQLSVGPVRGVPPVERPGELGIAPRMIEVLESIPDSDRDRRARPTWLPLPTASEAHSSATLLMVLRITVEITVATILLLLAHSVMARFARKRRGAREREFRRQWQPVLYGRMAGDDVPLPHLAAEDRLLFLMLFLETLGQVRDEAADALSAVAGELEIGPFVLAMLSGRAAWKRVIAVQCSAALRLRDAIDPLMRIVARNRPRDSLAAAAALLRIDAQHGLAAIAPLLGRIDWSPGAVASMLKRSGVPSEILLASLLQSSPPARLKQVVKLIDLLGNSNMLDQLRAIISQSSDPETIAAGLHALRAFGGEADRATAIGFLPHPEWVVRMQAAYALGGLGTAQDARILEPLLRDRNWWVRYRAAQAVLLLCGESAASAAAEGESDPYARDMLRRVVAEQS